MKAIKKSTLISLVRLTKEYATTGNISLLDKRIDVGRQLSRQAYGNTDSWTSFIDFAHSVLGVYPLHPECTDEEFCELFRTMNFEVLDE